MNDFSHRKKVSDGIRRSKINKSIYKNTYSGITFSSEGSRKNNAIIDKKKKKKIKNKEIENIVINNYVEDDYEIKKSFFKKFFDFLVRKKRLLKNIVFILLYVYILFFIFNKLEKTKIIITPKREIISEIENIKLYRNPEYNQLGFSIIMLSDSRSKRVKATEKVSVSDKASGIITIFNNYSTEPQRLSPETRFESVSGKIFKINDEWIEIPGKTEKGPGKLDVMVYAAEAGPEYNIDVTDFTIPGFKEAGLTAKYNDIYAMSLKKFEGGFDGEKLVVSEEQKNTALSELETELKELLINELKIEKTNRAILVNNSIQILFKEPIVEDNKDGSFEVKQDAQIFAVLIEKNNLERFLRNKYLPNTTKNEVVLLNTDDISFNYKGSEINFSNLNNINVEMTTNGVFEWNIDKNLVVESLLGLDKKYVPQILKEFEEIDSAKIQIQPFWQKTISKDIKHIELKIN